MTSSAAPLFSLAGKKGLILGVANDRSIAWGCTKLFRELGADVVATCLNEKARKYVQPLTDAVGVDLLNCDVEEPGQLEAAVAHAVDKFGQIDFLIHSIAWAPLADLHGQVVDSSRDGFARAMSVSCHSFAEVAKLCAPHMPAGDSMLSMTYLGSGEVVPNYGHGPGQSRAGVAGALHGHGVGPAKHPRARCLPRPHPDPRCFGHC